MDYRNSPCNLLLFAIVLISTIGNVVVQATLTPFLTNFMGGNAPSTAFAHSPAMAPSGVRMNEWSNNQYVPSPENLERTLARERYMAKYAPAWIKEMKGGGIMDGNKEGDAPEDKIKTQRLAKARGSVSSPSSDKKPIVNADDDYTKARRPAAADSDPVFEAERVRVLNELRENAPKVEATALLENNVLTLKFLAENAASEINIWHNGDLYGDLYSKDCSPAEQKDMFTCNFDFWIDSKDKDKKYSIYVNMDHESLGIDWFMDINLDKCQMVGSRKMFINSRPVQSCPVMMNAKMKSLPRDLDANHGTY